MAERKFGGFTNLTQLPDVPLDKIVSFLSAQDLRAFHQVSKRWKEVLEKRPKENNRRSELVEKIRINKENENIGSRSQGATPATASDARRIWRERATESDEKKSDVNVTPCLKEFTNMFDDTPKSSHYASTPDCSNLLTPSRFEFQMFEEATKQLRPGQKLFQCGKCRGPVPSPPVDQRNESRRPAPESTRCKLTSRMPDSPQKREYKKAKKSLPSADLSPIPYSPTVTVASLGEKMTHSLVVSSPCLATSTISHFRIPRGQSTDTDLRRSTSCSSITGIDLPVSASAAEHSSINLSFNFNLSGFQSSPSTCYHEQPVLDISRLEAGCSRSCCGRIDGHTSHLSDSNLSFNSDPNNLEEYSFRNMIASPNSPTVPVLMSDSSSHRSCEIERARDFQDFSASDGALSLTNVQFQRSGSIQNSSGSGYFNECNPVLECPNPLCRHKFCSGCEESEHPGRPCRGISSDLFESLEAYNNTSLDTNRNNISSASFTNSSLNSIERHRDNSRKKGKSKKSLRRIAKGP